MVDRLSTYWIYKRPVNDMLQLQSNLNRTQEQISTGKRMLSPADDPVGSARVLQLDQEISLLGQYDRNINLLESRLEAEEGILDSIEETVQRVRELTVQAGNAAVYDADQRKAIGVEIGQRVDELFDLMNSKDGSGEYLFSGFAGQTQPFVNNPGGGYSYEGDEGVRFLQVSKTINLASSDSGKEAFVDVPAVAPSFFTYANSENRGQPPGVISAGMTTDQDALNSLFPDDAVITFENELDVEPPHPNFTVRRKSDGRVIEGLEHQSYGPGRQIRFSGMALNITGAPKPGDQFIVETSSKQSLLVTTDKLEFALNNYTEEPEYAEAYDKAIYDTLANIDNAISSISEVRARIGGRLNTADSTREQHADNKLAAQDIRSEIRDLDYAEAVSRLQMEDFILQAAQQSFANISRTNLFDYIS